MRSGRSWWAVVAGLVFALALTLAPAAGAAKKGGLEAKITWQKQGIPTIEADSYKDLGFGYGYALAKDEICTLADAYLTSRGERSMFFGPDARTPEGFTNLESDLFYQQSRDQKVVEGLMKTKGKQKLLPGVKAGVKGYVEGYNLFVKKQGKKIDDPACAGQPWVRKISVKDAYRRFYELVLYGSQGVAIDGIANAQPPSSPRPVPRVTEAQAARLADPLDAGQSGSNAWGLGSDATSKGGGITLANPHFPWSGPRRFWQAHLVIPGELNVSGGALIGSPIINIGHTQKMAWSHTVSTAFRFVPFALDLKPGDPTTYIVDGQEVPMEANQVTVQVLQPDGTLAPVSRTLYSTRYGPVTNEISGQSIFGWSTDTAYAMWDANVQFRLLNHFFETNHAQSVNELKKILKKYQGIPWVNTIASDSKGKALYADIGSMPNVPDAKVSQCNTGLGAITLPAAGLPVLDGSRSECDLATDPDSAAPGILGVSQQPLMIRRDYVANSNDSYWLTNVDQPLEGFARIIGAERTQRAPRTRVGLLMLHEVLGGLGFQESGKFTRKSVQDAVFRNRHYIGELWRNDLVNFCNANPTMDGSSGPVDVSEACPILANWDLHTNLDSRGALLFTRFVDRAGTSAARFSTPFDVADPVGTPAGLNTSDPAVETAFANAVSDLRDASIPLDAPYGDFHYELRGTEKVPIHGGEGGQGGFNAISDRFTAGVGYDDITSGSSFVMVTELSKKGKCPKDRSILTYSQSEDPTSKHYADQTRMFSQKQWVDPPFCAKEVVKTADKVKNLKSK